MTANLPNLVRSPDATQWNPGARPIPDCASLHPGYL
jgi:hypothetical protein